MSNSVAAPAAPLVTITTAFEAARRAVSAIEDLQDTLNLLESGPCVDEARISADKLDGPIGEVLQALGELVLSRWPGR